MTKLNKLKSITNYLNVFSTPFDALKFRKLYHNKLNDLKEVSLRVKEAKNNLVFARPNTTDAQVLWDTFYRKYHLPPIPLRDDAIIVDLGSNVGYTIMHFAFLYPKSHIYGVEMDLNNFELAKKNIGSFEPQCSIIHAAVWSNDGYIKYDGKGEWGYKVLYDDSQKEMESCQQAPAKTLDTIFTEFNLKIVDYLKMDIEGTEKFVLENPGKWINIVKSMKIEIHPPADITSCLQILKNYGFNCYKDDNHPMAIIAIKN
jgi:FkbM family methyltransferase